MIDAVTFKGKELDSHGYSSGYMFDLLQAGFGMPFPGDCALDITPREDAVHLTFRSHDDGNRAIEVLLPARPWNRIIAERLQIVTESDRLLKNGTLSQIDTHEAARRQHHNASATSLQLACAAQSIDVDFETARNLFAVVAQSLEGLIEARAPGAQPNR